MRKKTFLIPAAMIVVALIIGWPLPSRTAQLCPTSPTLTEDGLVSMGNFGAVPYTPTLDTTPLFNCALQFAHSHNLRAIYFPKGRDRNTARATLGQGMAVSAFPRYVPV
jgi:hypothetical protein